MLTKTKIYYVSYKLVLANGEIYGSGTFKTKGLPKLGEWIEEIKAENSTKIIKYLVVLSCIEVDEDFIK